MSCRMLLTRTSKTGLSAGSTELSADFYDRKEYYMIGKIKSILLGVPSASKLR